MPINTTVPGRSLDPFTNWGNALNGDGTKYLDNNGQFTSPSGGFNSGITVPSASPSNPNMPAQYYNTVTGFSYNWDINSQAWVATPKLYRALISQSGTSAPTVDAILDNTLGITPTWSYINVGVYQLNGAVFVGGKAMALMAQTKQNTVMYNYVGDDGHIIFYSTYIVYLDAEHGGPGVVARSQNDILDLASLQVLVYP